MLLYSQTPFLVSNVSCDFSLINQITIKLNFIMFLMQRIVVQSGIKLINNKSLFLSPFHWYSTVGQINDKIEKMINNNKVVVFMKGVPDSPRCGFSNAVVQVLIC